MLLALPASNRCTCAPCFRSCRCCACPRAHWGLVSWHWNEYLFRKLGFDRTPLPINRHNVEHMIPTMKAYDIKKGNVVEHNGTVYQIRDIERSSPQGRGGNVKFRFTMYCVPGGSKFDLQPRRRRRSARKSN